MGEGREGQVREKNEHLEHYPEHLEYLKNYHEHLENNGEQGWVKDKKDR